MRTIQRWGLAGLVSVAALTACTTEGRQDVRETAQMTETEFARERAEMQRDMQSSIDDLDRKMSKIDNDLATASDKVKMELQEERDELRETQDQIKTEMARIERATEEEWSELKIEVGNTYDDLKAGMKNEIREGAQSVENMAEKVQKKMAN